MWRTLASLLARFHACTQSKFVACGGPWRVYYLDPSKVNKCEPPLKDRGHHGNCRHAPGEGSGGRRSGVQLLQVDMEETKGCQCPAIRNMVTERHNIASRMILKVVREGS
eukprot:1144813-Pelagomonas_calceolata.AAC.4